MSVKRSSVCCGCQEAPGTIKVDGLGMVCESCHEVLPVVFEVEIARVRAACRVLDAVITDLKENGV